MIDDRRSGRVKFTGKLDSDIMLYVVPAGQPLGSNINDDTLTVFKFLQLHRRGTTGTISAISLTVIAEAWKSWLKVVSSTGH